MPVDAELEALIEEKVQAALSGTRSGLMLANDRLDTIEEQLSRLLGDPSIARSMGSPVWMSGVSILNGTISAAKLSVNELEAITTNTGDLNATGNITAAASYPATGARVVMNQSGLIGYSGAATTTFKLNTDGSGEIGTGANKITWTAGGIVSIPAAVIQNLTIGIVGGGTFGGQYTSSSTYPRIEIDVAGIRAKPTSGTTSFELAAATGNVSIIGTFSIKSSTSGQRIELTNSSIAGYDSSGVNTFILNVSGSGRLGPSGSNSIAWDGNGVSIGGVSLTSTGKLTASHMSIDQLSSLSADLGSITAGTITGGTLTSGTITATTISASTFSGGTITGANVNVTGQLTLGSGGKIVDGAGSYWDSTGIKLIAGGSGSSATLVFQTAGGVITGGMATDPYALYLSANGGRSVHAYVNAGTSESRGFWLQDDLGYKKAGFCINGHLHIGPNGLATYTWSNWSSLQPSHRMTVYNMAGDYVGSIPVFNI